MLPMFVCLKFFNKMKRNEQTEDDQWHLHCYFRTARLENKENIFMIFLQI